MMFMRCDCATISRNCNCDWSCHVTAASPAIAQIKHVWFVRLSVRLSHWLYKLKPITLTSKMMWHLGYGRVFQVNRKCKKYRSLENVP